MELPDDIDGPADLDDFVKDAAPFAKLSAVRVEPVETAAGSSVSGLSGSRRDESESESGQDGSGQLRADLYRVLSPEAQELATLIDEALPAWQRQTEPADRQVTSLADFIAEWLIGFGYRRVVEDDTTVERVIIVLHAEWCGCDEVEAHHDGYRHALDDAARAAVRAVRGDAQERCQGCGEPLSEGGHGMSEFGGCV